MLVRITCSDCPAAARVDTDRAAVTLRAQGGYGFGGHISDPRAFAIRLMSRAGWRRVIRVGKSTITMQCVEHHQILEVDGIP